MSRPEPPAYRSTNWPVYNAALARRGPLPIWFEPGTQWLAAPAGKRGRQPVFTGAAILAFLLATVPSFVNASRQPEPRIVLQA